MAFLGVPFRILYEAVNLETDLSLVTVRILRPGSVSVEGPYDMLELPAPFSGRYYFDYPSELNDPEGDYFAFISSPMDDVVTTFRFELYTPWSKVSDVQAAVGASQSALLNSISVLSQIIMSSNDDAGLNVSEILSRLTQARANLLDNLSNLDALVSSRVATSDPRLVFLDASVSAAIASSSAQTVSDAIIEIEVDDIEYEDLNVEFDEDDSADDGFSVYLDDGEE